MCTADINVGAFYQMPGLPLDVIIDRPPATEWTIYLDCPSLLPEDKNGDKSANVRITFSQLAIGSPYRSMTAKYFPSLKESENLMRVGGNGYSVERSEMWKVRNYRSLLREALTNLGYPLPAAPADLRS